VKVNHVKTIVIAIGILCVPVGDAQTPVSIPIPPPAFDVASVKVNTGPGRGFGPIQYTADSLTARGISLWMAVRWAYGLENFRIAGPDSIESAPFFDIVAKAVGPVPESRLRLMLRSLLAERFHLTVHMETKEMPVTALIAAKGGVKFHESAGKYDPGLGAEAPFQFLGYDSSAHIQRTQEPGGRIRDSYTNVSMTFFAALLELMGSRSPLDKLPVTDATGMPGRYDFAIVPDPPQTREGDAASAPDDVLGGFKLILEKQLGLTLEHRKAMIGVLVVDHVDKTPTAN
jgi:uncharacterized protein (TIGR03435 family)